MRSVVLAGLVVLAGCEPADQAPAEPSASPVESIDLIGGPSDPPALPPTIPGDLSKVRPALPGDANKAPISIPADNLVKGKYYQALGTEPFWSVEVTPEALVYKTPENPAGTRIAYTTAKVASDTRYFGKLGGEQVILLIMPAKCSDGMSDTIYSYSATWSIGAEIRGGCARLK